MNWESFRVIVSLELIILIFLVYFSIVIRSKIVVTLLVVIVRSHWLAWIKLAKILDLISLKVLLILAMYKLDLTINLVGFAKLIGTNTYLLEDFLVVMLNLGFSFFSLFITLYISLIFLYKRFRKFSLIFIISLMLAKDIWPDDYLFYILFHILVIFPFSL